MGCEYDPALVYGFYYEKKIGDKKMDKYGIRQFCSSVCNSYAGELIYGVEIDIDEISIEKIGVKYSKVDEIAGHYGEKCDVHLAISGDYELVDYLSSDSDNDDSDNSDSSDSDNEVI